MSLKKNIAVKLYITLLENANFSMKCSAPDKEVLLKRKNLGISLLKFPYFRTLRLTFDDRPNLIARHLVPSKAYANK